MSDISLSKAVRSNLLSLQSTANTMAKTQTRLATGLKVNSALDNPTNFFTAASLNGRAGDMSNLLDSMSSGIKTIEAADNGLKSITKTVESMQSTLRQARQDKSFKTQSFAIDAAATGTASQKNLSFSGGAVGSSPVDVGLNTPDVAGGTHGNSTWTFAATTYDDTNDMVQFNISVDGGPATFVNLTNANALVASTGNDGVIDTGSEMQTLVEMGLSDAGVTGVTVSHTSTTITISSDTYGTNSKADIGALVGYGSGGVDTSTTNRAGLPSHVNTPGTGSAPVTGSVKSVDAMVQAINSNSSLTDKVRASNDGGKLRIENLSTEELTVTGLGSGGELDGTSGTVKIGGNDVRANLVKQYNNLRDQLDKFADDASFNGINLLRGDKLKLTFNETGSSTIEIQAEDQSGQPTSINSTSLRIDEATNADFDADASLDTILDTMKGALDTLRSQSSSFGSNLSVVENRNEFTKSMINTLDTGAANLTLADTNQEAANLLALQTRQQLSSSALSMASQADQAVLRLF